MLASLAGLGLATTASAASGTGSNPAGGNSANNGNFTNGTADFSTLTLSAAPTVTLDGARTLGNLTFGDVGCPYVLQRATNLVPAVWLDISPYSATTNGGGSMRRTVSIIWASAHPLRRITA